MGMLDEAICPLCGQGWCGRPCMRDPKKQNALLFDSHGEQKTLKQRGLAWDDPPLAPAAPAPRRKPTMVLLKALEKRGVTKPAATKTSDATKTVSVAPPVSVAPMVAKKGGRPKTGAMSSTERSRKRRAAAKSKPKE